MYLHEGLTMRNFLIPVDFSDVSYTAAQYAVDMAAHLNARKIIFYHSYAHRPSDGFDAEANYQQSSLKHLEKMKVKLQMPAGWSPEIHYLADDKPVRAGVEAIVSEHAVSLIVMGIAGLSDIENTLIGRNTMAV